jgi:hypothetical protein
VPAIDTCEPQVIRALEKAGWVVTDRPYAIRIYPKQGFVYADLRLRNRQQQTELVVIEVKCFLDNRPPLDEFYHAVGQYIYYRNALHLDNQALPLYLAVPLSVYNTFIQRDIVQATLKDAKINLVVVDLDAEAIAQWIIT